MSKKSEFVSRVAAKHAGIVTEVETKQIVRSFLEATQRGFTVGVVVKGGERIFLSFIHTKPHTDKHGLTKGIDKAYESAKALATSVDRGRYVGSLDGVKYQVNGKKLKVTRTVQK